MNPKGGITPGADCRLNHIRECWRAWSAVPKSERDIDYLALMTGLTHAKLRTDYLPMMRKMEMLLDKGIDAETILLKDRNAPTEKTRSAEDDAAGAAFDKQLEKDLRLINGKTPSKVKAKNKTSDTEIR
jgi:hypothetical protein